MFTVDVSVTIRAVEPRIIGMNTDFLTDHEIIRQAGNGYVNALRRMGIRSLRYPGGEKSDEYFWSAPPWKSPRPALALTGPKGRLAHITDYVENCTTFRYRPLDFDQFMLLCAELDAEPTICVNFDSMYLPPVSDHGVAPTKAQLLEHAVEWVRYANVVRGYGVKYWELGNESYLLGGNGAARAVDYARDFQEFARAMKAVDPTILIGANGNGRKDAKSKVDGEDGPIWWQTLLEQAGPQIDFLVVHPYPCWMWGSYSYYPEHEPNFTEAVDQAEEALHAWASPGDAERIRILSTETNAADWAASEYHHPGLKGWPLVNDLGHALVLFEILGQHLLHPKVDMAEVWNTRWVHPTEKELWNTLDENNDFNATGYAVAIWGQNLKQNMVRTASSTTIRTFASHDPVTQELSVFIINKATRAQHVDLELSGYVPSWEGPWSMLTGEGSEDPSPVFAPVRCLSGEGTGLGLDLAPVSVSVLALSPRRS